MGVLCSAPGAPAELPDLAQDSCDAVDLRHHVHCPHNSEVDFEQESYDLNFLEACERAEKPLYRWPSLNSGQSI